uniref:Succinate-semialdehyde dehydrogenase, mitochondrial n=1 Tax=Chaetoceros debilis TaxID=122233 RepID=A0A7S3Q3D3_9STRA
MVRSRSSRSRVIASGILLLQHTRTYTSTSTAYVSVDALSTSINLHNPSLLRAPAVTFHRESLEVYDPSASQQQVEDGSAVLALVEAMNRKDVTLAIDKSNAALKQWKFHTTALHRSGLLSKWSSLIKENAKDIAKIMTMESGKPLHESIGEVNYGTSFIDFFAAEALRMTGAGGGFMVPSPFASPDGSPKGRIMAVNEAVGVTAMITPWNFPLAMITRKVGPALAAGCTVIVKPSELTPLTAIALKQLADEAGIPPNVFQLIISDTDQTPSIGEELCTNPIVKKFSFTGSTAVGRLLMEQSSSTIKRISLELGGNAPFIVFEDADIEQAGHAAMASKFRNAGQTCVCADRFIIHDSVVEDFTQLLKEKVLEIKVGHGLDEGIDMGPLILPLAAESVQIKVREAIADGAKCVIGGSTMDHMGPNYFEPTILTDVKATSRIWNTETFGPVAAIATFHHEQDAIDLANDSSTGLASYMCTNDMSRAFRVAEHLEDGMVGINEGVISTATAPFGGVKESGLGREGSSVGLSEYLETKYIFLNA